MVERKRIDIGEAIRKREGAEVDAVTERFRSEIGQSFR